MHVPRACLVDRSTTLRAALSWDHPYSITPLEAGRTATTRDLRRSVHVAFETGRPQIIIGSTYRHGCDSFSIVHARNGELVDGSVLTHGDRVEELALVHRRNKVQ